MLLFRFPLLRWQNNSVIFLARQQKQFSFTTGKAMQTTKILLSGASGMIGTTVVRTLAERQISFYKLVRRPVVNHHQEIFWNPVSDTPFLESALLEGFSTVIHLGGANIAGHSWTPAYKQELAESRVRTTRILSQTLAGLKSKPQILLCASAVGYYGDRGEEWLTEGSSHGNGFLSELCVKWEEATEAAEKAGIRVVHLRLGVVIGPGAGALRKMLPAFRLGLGGRLGSGRQWMSWVSLEDVVAAILFLIEDRGISGPVNLVSPNPVTNAEFTRTLAHLLHRPAILPIPAFILRGIFGEMAQETMLASSRALPERLLATGFRFQQERLSEALRAALR